MNSILEPIFNIFLYVNSTINMFEHYINSGFYPLHNEPYEITIHAHKKKKKHKIGKRATRFSQIQTVPYSTEKNFITTAQVQEISAYS